MISLNNFHIVNELFVTFISTTLRLFKQHKKRILYQLYRSFTTELHFMMVSPNISILVSFPEIMVYYCFCNIVDQRNVGDTIFHRDHRQEFWAPQKSRTRQDWGTSKFGFLEWSCKQLTTKLRRHNISFKMILVLNKETFF